MTTILSTMQSDLENFYEVSVPHNVLDFLITDKSFAEAVTNTSINNSVLEQLLVYSDDDYLDVSLYLDNNLVERLDKKHSPQIINNNELHDFWIALEGVSHFLYLAWNARYDRPVSQLELELQAEVDKFVSATNAVLSKDDPRSMHEIWELLFSNPEYRDDLDQQALQRYQKANEYASQYCALLIKMQNKPAKSIENELRRFYRLRQKEKIYRINKLNS